MYRCIRFSRGRADPLGLLVLAVMLALSLTIAIQARVLNTSLWSWQQATADCAQPASSDQPACR